MGEWTRTTVRCISGYKADERPLEFLYGNDQLAVRKITESWYEPEGVCFRIKANDGHIYLLEHDERNDTWKVKQISNRRQQPFITKGADHDDLSNGKFTDMRR